MPNPKSVDEFFAEATRQAVKDSANMQDALRQYVDQVVTANRTYFAACSEIWQDALRTTFDLQNATLQATRTTLDASTQANQSLIEQWAKAVRQGQSASSKLMAAGTRLIDATIPAGRSQ